MKTHIIKVAFHTLGRAGISTALFFLLGLYLLFPSAASFLALRKDKKDAFEITAVAAETVDLGELADIKGVKRLSPVIKFKCKISYGDYVSESEIEGILGSYLDSEDVFGAIFPDGSNMPYLIINEKASETFKNADGRSAQNIAVNDKLRI